MNKLLFLFLIVVGCVFFSNFREGLEARLGGYGQVPHMFAYEQMHSLNVK